MRRAREKSSSEDPWPQRSGAGPEERLTTVQASNSMRAICPCARSKSEGRLGALLCEERGAQRRWQGAEREQGTNEQESRAKRRH